MNKHEFFVSKEDVLGKYKEYFKFVVTRNPYERVVSYYCNKIINRQSSLVLDDKGKMTNKNCQLNFHQFCKFLLRMRKKYKLEHHAKPQFYGLEDIQFDQIIDLKDLDQALPEIHKKLRIEEERPFRVLIGDLMNRKTKGEEGNKGDKISNQTKYDPDFKKNVAKKKPKTFKRIPGFTYFYDDESTRVIKQIYKLDFEKFGYSKKLGEGKKTREEAKIMGDEEEGKEEAKIMGDEEEGKENREEEGKGCPKSVNIFTASQELD